MGTFVETDRTAIGGDEGRTEMKFQNDYNADELLGGRPTTPAVGR